MRNDEVALVGIRILGLYLLAQGILELPNLYALVQLKGDYEFSGLLVFLHSSAIFAPMVLGILVLVFSSVIARGVSPSPSLEPEAEKMSWQGIESLGFALLGLAIVFISLPELLSASISIYQSNTVNERQVSVFTSPAFLSPFIALLLGCFLFVGVRFWVGLYGWLRELGLERK